MTPVSAEQKPTGAPLPTIRPYAEPTPLPTTIYSSEPAANFAIRLAYSSCGPATRVLDTFTQTLRQQSYDDAKPRTITLTLSGAELRTVYDHMIAINFFNYPARFSIPLGSDESRAFVSTYPEYRLAARNGTQTVDVSWSDDIIQPTTKEAEQLRSLIQMIIGIVDQQSELSALPPLREACA